jgi:hypothetical protein
LPVGFWRSATLGQPPLTKTLRKRRRTERPPDPVRPQAHCAREPLHRRSRDRSIGPGHNVMEVPEPRQLRLKATHRRDVETGACSPCASGRQEAPGGAEGA